MKKYVQEATDINVWTSLKDNTFDRGKDIREFIEGLELIEGNAFISLDAKWGDGKTFFVRQIEETLKYFWAKKMETEEKPLKDLNSYEYLKESVAVKQTTVEHIYLPVYYNAWMYDDHNDPLMSLLLVMTKQCGGAYNTKINTKSLGERLLAVAFFPTDFNQKGKSGYTHKRSPRGKDGYIECSQNRRRYQRMCSRCL